jgi:hypothetical protein
VTNEVVIADPQPRRSVRTNKGQPKISQLDQAVEAPKRRGKKAQKHQDDDEVVRCVCGATSAEGWDFAWIACDKCDVWQHNSCMGLSEFAEDTKKQDYWCELCEPNNHRELLDALARGEKPWEERNRNLLENGVKDTEMEEAKPKKTAKGGRRSKRYSEVKEEMPSQMEMSPPPAKTTMPPPAPASHSAEPSPVEPPTAPPPNQSAETEPTAKRETRRGSTRKRKASDAPEPEAKVRFNWISH